MRATRLVCAIVALCLLLFGDKAWAAQPARTALDPVLLAPVRALVVAMNAGDDRAIEALMTPTR